MVQVGTKRKRDWESKHANDIIGVVVLEVGGADDLPAWPNGMVFCRFCVIFLHYFFLYYPIPFSPSYLCHLDAEIHLFISPFFQSLFYTRLIFSNQMLTHHPAIHIGWDMDPFVIVAFSRKFSAPASFATP